MAAIHQVYKQTFNAMPSVLASTTQNQSAHRLMQDTQDILRISHTIGHFYNVFHILRTIFASEGELTTLLKLDGKVLLGIADYLVCQFNSLDRVMT